MKRALDLVVSALALAGLAPILLAVAALVWREDGRPVFYRQPRVGRDGRIFGIVKFRTMRTAAGPPITVRGDPRITAFGARLRRWKLDELPQLWNVLRGDMSLVGPRPEVPEYVAGYSHETREVLRLRPGITGPAQLDHLDEEAELGAAADPERYYRQVLLPRKLEADLAYVRARTFAGDLAILWKTARSMVSRPDASADCSGRGAERCG